MHLGQKERGKMLDLSPAVGCNHPSPDIVYHLLTLLYCTVHYCNATLDAYTNVLIFTVFVLYNNAH